MIYSDFQAFLADFSKQIRKKFVDGGGVVSGFLVDCGGCFRKFFWDNIFPHIITAKIRENLTLVGGGRKSRM